MKVRPGTVEKERIDKNMGTNKEMTDLEKKSLQAKHRMEEAQARNREKERKVRTRRLIQEGAVLEIAFPEAKEMSMKELEAFLKVHLQRHL